MNDTKLHTAQEMLRKNFHRGLHDDYWRAPESSRHSVEVVQTSPEGELGNERSLAFAVA